MSARSQRVLLQRQSGFLSEWDPVDPNDCYKQARAIFLALINFNALAHAVYADVPSRTRSELKGLATYQMFVELLNYFYVLDMDQWLLWRLGVEHDRLEGHIRRMRHINTLPFMETGAVLRNRLRDIPNEELFELYLWIELRKLPQQRRPHTISKFFPFYSQVGHRVCFTYQ